MRRWWERIRDFFRSGRNAEFPESETLDAEIVGEPEVEPEVEEERREVGKMLAIRPAPEGEGSEDEYERYRGTPLMQAIAPSGIWVVIKFSEALEAGQFEEDFRSAQIVKARTGEEAIMAVYARDMKQHGERTNLVNAKMEDGRYVALDFYTGHRVEHSVRGEWRAELLP